MSKIEKSETLPPVSKVSLSKNAYLAHLDNCRACALREDFLRVESGEVRRIKIYSPCTIGTFLRDLWQSMQSEK